MHIAWTNLSMKAMPATCSCKCFGVCALKIFTRTCGIFAVGEKTYERKNNEGKTLADSMVRGIHMMLHEALDAAVKERLIVRNPTNGTTVPKPNYPDKQVLDDGQLEKFLGMIEAYPDWRDFFYTECMTGLRRGEICGLKWSDIDFENRRLQVERSLSAVTNGKIQIGETKTGAGKRTIVLPPTLAALLAKRKENALNEWVFYNPCNPNLPMNPAAAYQKLHTILKNAELPRIRFHDLRHTFATHATKGGVDPKTLSGISDTQTRASRLTPIRT